MNTIPDNLTIREITQQLEQRKTALNERFVSTVGPFMKSKAMDGNGFTFDLDLNNGITLTIGYNAVDFVVTIKAMDCKPILELVDGVTYESLFKPMTVELFLAFFERLGGKELKRWNPWVLKPELRRRGYVADVRHGPRGGGELLVITDYPDGKPVKMTYEVLNGRFFKDGVNVSSTVLALLDAHPSPAAVFNQIDNEIKYIHKSKHSYDFSFNPMTSLFTFRSVLMFVDFKFVPGDIHQIEVVDYSPLVGVWRDRLPQLAFEKTFNVPSFTISTLIRAIRSFVRGRVETWMRRERQDKLTGLPVPHLNELKKALCNRGYAAGCDVGKNLLWIEHYSMASMSRSEFRLVDGRLFFNGADSTQTVLHYLDTGPLPIFVYGQILHRLGFQKPNNHAYAFTYDYSDDTMVFSSCDMTVRYRFVAGPIHRIDVVSITQPDAANDDQLAFYETFNETMTIDLLKHAISRFVNKAATQSLQTYREVLNNPDRNKPAWFIALFNQVVDLGYSVLAFHGAINSMMIRAGDNAMVVHCADAEHITLDGNNDMVFTQATLIQFLIMQKQPAPVAMPADEPTASQQSDCTTLAKTLEQRGFVVDFGHDWIRIVVGYTSRGNAIKLCWRNEGVLRFDANGSTHITGSWFDLMRIDFTADRLLLKLGMPTMQYVKYRIDHALRGVEPRAALCRNLSDGRENGYKPVPAVAGYGIGDGAVFWVRFFDYAVTYRFDQDSGVFKVNKEAVFIPSHDLQRMVYRDFVNDMGVNEMVVKIVAYWKGDPIPTAIPSDTVTETPITNKDQLDAFGRFLRDEPTAQPKEDWVTQVRQSLQSQGFRVTMVGTQGDPVVLHVWDGDYLQWSYTLHSPTKIVSSVTKQAYTLDQFVQATRPTVEPTAQPMTLDELVALFRKRGIMASYDGDLAIVRAYELQPDCTYKPMVDLWGHAGAMGVEAWQARDGSVVGTINDSELLARYPITPEYFLHRLWYEMKARRFSGLFVSGFKADDETYQIAVIDEKADMVTKYQFDATGDGVLTPTYTCGASTELQMRFATLFATQPTYTYDTLLASICAYLCRD